MNPQELREAISDALAENLMDDNYDVIDHILEAVIQALPEHKEIVEAKTEFGIAMNWSNPRYNQAIEDIKALLTSAKSESKENTKAADINDIPVQESVAGD